MSNGSQVSEVPPGAGIEKWPLEVRALVASLRVQNRYIDRDRRRGGRKQFEVQATLWFKDQKGQPQRENAYTRDLSGRMIALVSTIHLKPGQSVILDLPSTGGEIQRKQGHIRRCRQLDGGWYDCVLELDNGAKRGR